MRNDLIPTKEDLRHEAQEAQEAEEVTVGRPLLRVLSLGAGVQSSTLYLMAVRGEFGSEGPTVAVFADTQWEPAHTYRWLDEMERIGGDVVPIQRVTTGSLRDDIVDGASRGHRIANIPYHTMQDGKRKLMRRTCTKEYKLVPIARAVRAALNAIRKERVIRGRLTPGSVEMWIGISTEEASRMADSRVAYVRNHYPLIERNMSRTDCKTWLAINGFPEPPKSACIGCPFHDDTFWLEMRENRPDEWADAVAVDAFIRNGKSAPNAKGGGMAAFRNGGEAYLHGSMLPLSEAPLTYEEKAAAGDAKRPMVNMWENDCTGSCGV